MRVGTWEIKAHCSRNGFWIGIHYEPARRRITVGLPLTNLTIEPADPSTLPTSQMDHLRTLPTLQMNRLTTDLPASSPMPDKTGAHALFAPPKMSMFGIMKFREEHVGTFCRACFFKYCGEHWAPIIKEQCLPCLMKDHSLNGNGNVVEGKG